MTHLALDAAYPPSPQQWVADMNAVGADGGFVYVYGPIVKYTLQHVTVARQSGKIVIPIIVPGNTWPTFGTLKSNLLRYGFQSGPVVVDLESSSLPPNAGLANFALYMQQNGYQLDRYGTQSVLGTYTPENEDWIADWIRTGQLGPLPTLPQGWQSWQFVNDVKINGSTYDASIVSDSFVTGSDAMTLDDARLIVRMIYTDCRRGEPETEDAINGWANKIVADPENTFIAMVDPANGEFANDLSIDRQMRADYEAGKLGGSTAPADALAQLQATVAELSADLQAIKNAIK